MTTFFLLGFCHFVLMCFIFYWLLVGLWSFVPLRLLYFFLFCFFSLTIPLKGAGSYKIWRSHKQCCPDVKPQAFSLPLLLIAVPIRPNHSNVLFLKPRCRTFSATKPLKFAQLLWRH